MSFIHPDHWEGVKFNWRNLKSAHKKIVQELCNFDGKGYQWWEFRYTTKQLFGGEYKTAGLLLNIQDIKKIVKKNWKLHAYWLKRRN